MSELVHGTSEEFYRDNVGIGQDYNEEHYAKMLPTNETQLDRIERKLDTVMEAIQAVAGLAEGFASTPMAGVLAKFVKRGN